MTKRTSKQATFEVLGGYLMSNNRVNVGYLADQVRTYAVNKEPIYIEQFNTRRKTRNIAIEELMAFIDHQLFCNGYRDFYATNQQVMAFDNDHAGDLERVLDIIEAEIIEERATY